MKKEKVYHLKTWPKVLLVVLVFIGALSYYLKGKYDEYIYHNSYEYKILELGYKMEDYNLLRNKLTDDELNVILEKGYDEFIPMFVKTKYFMFKNLDGYLSQVITQNEDFFKYHGVEGYDYDHIVALVNTHSITSPYTGGYKTDFTKGYGILANKYYELGPDYAPDDLVNIPLKYYYGDKKSIRQEVFDAFVNMWEAAYQEGIYLIVDSGYRAYDKQLEVYNYYQDYKGTKYADSIAARPGYSEHQTGLALDIYSKECTVSNEFPNTKTYEWLINNSYKYGFILRYPKDKQDITGYNYESWHYRYLGVDLATKVYNEGITFDEYYAFYLDN